VRHDATAKDVCLKLYGCGRSVFNVINLGDAPFPERIL